MASLKICVYNYKGGASKTTVVVNLASALAAQGLKVLMIDLDPQCNLTQFWNPGDDLDTLTVGDVAQTGVAATLQALAGAAFGTQVLADEPHHCVQASSMSAYVSPFHETPLYRIMYALYTDMDVNGVEAALTSVDALQQCNPDETGDKLWLCKGSPLLVEFEGPVAVGIGAPEQRPAENQYKNIGIVAYLMRRMTELHNFDVILLDVGPSNSALNQMAALSCDYILPPCLASLYSCGSVSGLLSAVLPGTRGWFGKLEAIAETQWRPDWVSNPSKASLLPWRLPAHPPKLLPILVNNYGTEYKAAAEGLQVAKRATRGAGAAALATVKQIRFGASQFYYTICQFVDHDCAYVEGSDAVPPPDFRGPKVIFERNHGRKVIPFAPSVPVSMPASEALGRPFVQLKLGHFTEFYGFQPSAEPNTSSMGLVAGKKRKVPPSKAVKELMMLLGEASSDSADQVFAREVALMKERYESLAKWIMELLLSKRT